MHEEDPSENAPRPAGGKPEGSGAPRAPAAPLAGGAAEPSSAAGNPSIRPGASGPGAGVVVRSRPVPRPVTIGQLQRILEMRLGFTVSENTLERWCRHGKIYAFRLGSAWRIPREEVERIVRSAVDGES